MKHLKQVERKCSETALYRYVVGFLITLLETVKDVLKAVLKHITELLIALAMVGMVMAMQAFDNNAINYTVCILFVLILAVLIVTLIKVKILESRGEKD